ncbi:MAG: heavy-metal-associated domain-containing protein [Bacteroidales bacterium]|nr:heavy-metal-associated domain-containing protein [Bacteroidales bacterium]
MRTIILIFGISFLILSCQQTTKEQAPSVEVSGIEISPENLVNVEFDVHGMTCDGCANTVKTSMLSVNGTKDASASFTDSIAVVSFDKTKASVEQIAEAIESKGYEVVDYTVIEEKTKDQ